MSVRDANDPVKRQERLEALRSDVLELLDYARSHGLQEFVIEPVPLTRETPHAVAEARGLLADLKHTIPVKFCVDSGHALYKPLYGVQAGCTWVIRWACCTCNKRMACPIRIGAWMILVGSSNSRKSRLNSTHTT